ncbi:hypothetical protein BS50DRAFT_625000 [Corynespora cassiicola Philippines]|uniref:Uncharacterized protein n=1 Tax=Corynespora cassiicola Philippines TaxID=1448308 RepID=A0A2T2NA47_CORCC|nr:hypothetical protein BS50DRAFT_625000 [Corynespora cassiicola Philippines]
MLLPFIIVISLAVLEAWAADQTQHQDNSTSSTLGPTTTGSYQVRATSTHILDIQTANPTESFNLSSNYMAIGLELAFLPLYNNNLSASLFTVTPNRTLHLAGPSEFSLLNSNSDTIEYNSSQMEPVICLSDSEYTRCSRESRFKLGP